MKMKTIERNQKQIEGYDLFREERRQAILARLTAAGRVSVTELSAAFGVSEVTVRADLQALAERKLVVRTHGGAMLAGGTNELALALRRQRQVTEKSRIGAAGAKLVEDGDAIFLDSSSTSLAIAHQLKQRRHMTVVTNSLEVAHELFDARGIDLIMLGGMLQHATASFVGAYGLEAIQGLNLQTGFFGAHGISLDAGLTDVNSDEAAVKRPLVTRCRAAIAVLDATKWGRVGVASFAELRRLDRVITDAGAPAELVRQVQAAGIVVDTV
jgi:DeoR/GlpR family transcriptional regulator of sugar metabolism